MAVSKAEKAAVKAAIAAAGSVAEFARRLNISPQVVVHWKNRGVPVKRVIDVEAATGVPRTKLRADIYPREEEQQAA